VGGCGFEHQLQSARVALQDTTPENKGFLRPNAHLAIVILSDEDDCSAPVDSDLFAQEVPGTEASWRCAREGHVCNGRQPPLSEFSAPLADCRASDTGKLIPVQQIVDSIRALKARPDEQILVSGIFGWPTNPSDAVYRFVRPSVARGIDYAPVCQSPSNGAAMAALRLKAFVEAFGPNGTFSSICQDDFRPTLRSIGEQLALRVGSICLPGPLVDAEPAPGVQPDCQVVERVPMAGAPSGFQETPVPVCAPGKSPPCWRPVQAADCRDSEHRLVFDRNGRAPSPGTMVAVRCTTLLR
jgi:hypothetical protein